MRLLPTWWKPPAWRLQPWLALFIFLFGFSMLMSSGHPYSSDEETMLAVAESLWLRGSFALEPDFLMNYAVGTDPEGPRYSRYGPGQSLLLLPFVALGSTLAQFAPEYATGLVMRLWVMLLPALLTAATAALLAAWIQSLGYSVRIALTVGLIYGLGSLALPFSRTLFAEPTVTMLLVLCCYALHRPEQRWWVVAGVAAATAISVKAQTLLALPVVALYALAVSWQNLSGPTWRVFIGRTLLGTLGALPIMLLYGLYNTLLFGHPLRTGYGGLDPGEHMNIAWQEGLYGLTLSSGKSLFLYAPCLLLGMVGLLMRRRQQGRESLLAVMMLVVHLAFYARIDFWHGDGSWGPRYMLVVVPFLLLPAAGLLDWLARPRQWLYRRLATFVLLLSFSIQLLPILANLNTYLQLANQYSRHFEPAASPLIGHWRLFQQRLDSWMLRLTPEPGMALLRHGFSYSEGDRSRGELLPRWSYADAEIYLYPARLDQPLNGLLRVNDHRPWPLERANFTLLLDGQPLEGVERLDRDGSQISWELRFQLPPERLSRELRLALRSDTWNPARDTADNPRDEDLALQVEALSFAQDGVTLELRESLPVPQPGRDRRSLWLWYYDPPNRHLLDHWLWFLLVAHLPRSLLITQVGFYGILGLTTLWLGWRGLGLSLGRRSGSTTETAS